MQATQYALPAGGVDLVTGTGGRAQRIKAIVGASSGNLVEWYDFYAYAFTSIYFAAAFFPSGDATSQLMATAGIFAVGFFMRPLGGWLFGWIADTHGRKNSMVISVPRQKLPSAAGGLAITLRLATDAIPSIRCCVTSAADLSTCSRPSPAACSGGRCGTCSGPG